MSYINDPREMAIRPESGVTLEQDNRVETMYHWGAMVLDLCDMPVSEYMKPMTVIVNGTISSGSGSDTKTEEETVNIVASLWKNGSAISESVSEVKADSTASKILNFINPAILGESSTDEWKVVWRWIGDFEGSVKSTVSVTIDGVKKYVTALLSDNDDKRYEKPIELEKDEEITNFSTYGIGSSESDESEIDGVHIYTTKTDNVEYTFKISENSTDIKLTFKRILSGTVVETKYYFYKDTIEPYTESTDKEGYDFEGWFYADNKPFTEGATMPSKNLIIYGKYKEKKYTVEFYLDDKLVKGLSGISYNTVLKSSQFPSTTKTGYNFLGWEPVSSTPITENTVFRGEYEAKEYTITWKFSGSTATTNLKYGEKIDYEAAAEQAKVVGLTLTKWSYTGATMPAYNLTITASYSLNYHILTYVINYNGEEEIRATARTAYGKSLAAISLPKEDGYSFTEWEGFPEDMKMPDADLKVVTYKTANEYFVEYYVNIDGASELIDTVSYLYGDTVSFRKPYSKEGYTVSDWSGEISPMPSHNITATCEATINQYIVTFLDENGNVVEAVSVDYGTSIKDIIPSIEGKTFTPNEDAATVVPNSDIEIKGTVTPNPYTVTINGVEVTLSFGDDIDEYINTTYPSSVGHHLVITPSGQTVPSNDDLAVKFEEVANVYSVSIGEDTIEITYGDTILDKLPKDVEEGYYIEGWYDQNQNKIDETTVMGDGDITSVEAKIEQIQTEYTITVDGSVVKTDKVAYGTKVSDIVASIDLGDKGNDEGYNVVWTVNGEPLTDEMIIKGEKLEITCEFVAKEYVLAFYNVSELISSALTAYKSAVTYPSMENKTIDEVEYVFKWSGETITEMPSHDVEIKGEYIVKPTAPLYYGAILHPTAATVDDIASLSSVTVTEAEASAAVTFIIPANEVYIEEYRKIKNKEITPAVYKAWKSQYIAESAYTFCVYIPKDVIDNGETLEWLDGLNNSLTYDKSLYSNVTIDGTEYVCYSMDDTSYYGVLEDGVYENKLILKK